MLEGESLIRLLLAVGLGGAVTAWALAFVVRRFAVSSGIVHVPGGRRQHAGPTPLLGGVAVGSVILAGLAILLFIDRGDVAWFGARAISDMQVLGFGSAVLLLMLGGALDDRFDLPPKAQILFPIASALIVLASGTTISKVTHWTANGTLELPSWLGGVLTLVWLLSVTYATKFLDGLDGLVSGQAVIGSGLIAGLALATAYYQPPVALLAVLIGGAYLGFLPHNYHPAKQFLGESGSVIAGFSLGFLAIVGGAKVATAFMALGLPLVDACLVLGGRILRGELPFKGDRTHLHFKLVAAGLSQRQAVWLMWSMSLLFGLAAFGLQTPGKLLLVLALAGMTLLLSWFAGVRIKSRT